MKKIVALVVMGIFLMQTVAAFAGDVPKSGCATSEKPSMVRTFFGDAQALFVKRIPETVENPKKKIWENKAEAAPAAAETK